MQDERKTKKQLINELKELRKILTNQLEFKSERQKAEENLRRKLIEYEKLSALGRLTANVAHGIRNPITVIGGLTSRLKKSFVLGTKEKEYLELIALEAKRLEDILRDILVFSNEPFFKKEKKDIHKVINESLEIYEDKIKECLIEVQKFYNDVAQIFIDERYVTEAINNMISNAIEAMPKGGILTITTSEESLHGKNYVSIKITDTGIGISEENLLMIFEPFFTTKITKKETGLGLSITKKIAEGHGGFITVNSSVGKGSTFSLYFPYRAK